GSLLRRLKNQSLQRLGFPPVVLSFAHEQVGSEPAVVDQFLQLRERKRTRRLVWKLHEPLAVGIDQHTWHGRQLSTMRAGSLRSGLGLRWELLAASAMDQHRHCSVLSETHCNEAEARSTKGKSVHFFVAF